MKTIYKYPIEIDDEVIVQIPEGGKILAVQEQHGIVCLWALVDTLDPLTERKFYVRGTGHSCAGLEETKYVGTFQLNGGALVFHLFEDT